MGKTKKAHKDPLAAHRTMESITGEGFLRRELALALKSDRGNRGRRMDLVLGMSDEQDWEDESDFESGSEGLQESGQGGLSRREGASRSGGDSKDGVSPVRVASKALRAAETLAKNEARRMKEERLMSLEADTSTKRRVTTSTRSDQKNYIVNIEDLNVKSMSKENSVPTFNTQRGTLPAKNDVNGITTKQTNVATGKAKHNQFMAKYGLQKYVNLFKPL